MSLQPAKISYNLELKVGDHIFSYRAAGYSHHGIYVGEVKRVRYVIHFTTTGNKGFLSCKSEKADCQICGYSPNHRSGVVKSCLDCFVLGESSVKVKDYGGNSRASHEVVAAAFKLLKHGFGQYDLLVKNCRGFCQFLQDRRGWQFTGICGHVGKIEWVEYAINFTSTGNKSFGSCKAEKAGCQVRGFTPTLRLACFVLDGKVRVKGYDL